jgi:ankyrin repeat protein
LEGPCCHHNTSRIVVDTAASAQGMTLLHYASRNGHADTTSSLLAHGENVKGKDELHHTALHHAAENGHGHENSYIVGEE